MNKKSWLAVSLVAVLFLSFHPFALGQNSAVPADPQTKIAELKSLLQQTPNHLQYTEYMMLKHKYPQAPADPKSNNYYYNDDYYLKPSGPSPLSREFSGSANGPDTGVFDGVDVITGQKAVDESLQIGSIGSDRGNARSTGDRLQIHAALELYFNDHSSYPENLNQLVPNYIGRLPEGFTYKKTGDTYELLASTAAQDQMDISQVQALEIKSHPWDSMIKTQPTIPAIFSFVPADDVMVYFRDMDKMSQLEQSITSIGKPIQSIYSLNNAVEVKDKMFKRLGIKDIKEMRSLVDEAGLVSYDLDAYPNTDYALILKVKSSLLNNFISTYISAPKENQAQVGDYYVIATDNSFLQSLINAQKNKDQSLAGKKDLAYALSVLENNYDGFSYFSEDFVKKLTGPAYRINARRRNTVLNALETLQYSVFAYRGITGAWPATIKQISDEGYIQPGTVANIDDYFVDSQGIVKNKIWGSIYDTTPLDRVTVTSITTGENNLYESFKQGYQNYWREYIDPIGVSIIVGDQIRFHTIILPLIDKSEYNWIKDIAGGDGIAFDFLTNPDRLPSLQGVMKLNVDDAIYAFYKEDKSEFDDGYKKCQDDYYSNYYKNKNADGSPKSMDDACKSAELTKEQAVTKVKDSVAKAIGWTEKTPVFDFIGNEITVAGGDNLVFNIDDLSNLDVYIGVDLKDPVLAKKFLDEVFAWYNKQMSDGESSKTNYGLFKVDSSKPIKNSYNGVDYYLVPLGFTNFYYAFFNNRFYMTVSQSAMNNLIDGKKNGALKQPENMARLYDYMGDKMNLGFVVNNTKLEPWLKGYIKDQWASYSGAASIRSTLAYYTESLELARALPNYDGSTANVKAYYRYVPTGWFDATLAAKNGKVYLTSNNQEYDLNDVDLGRGSYYGSNDDTKTKSVKLADITKGFNIDKTLNDWQNLKDLGIAFGLSNDGLDIKIAFSNTASAAIDSRIGKIAGVGFKLNANYVLGGVGVLVVLLVLFVIFYVIRKKHLPTVPVLPESSQAEQNMIVPTANPPVIDPTHKDGV